MLTITIASGKGGTCKTTLTATLAVVASKEAERVAVVDLNADQSSLTNWWKRRGEPAAPFLAELTDTKLRTELRALAATRFEFCLIDTPPDDMGVIEAAIAASDVVVVPVRASGLDVDGARAIVDICERRRKPFAFVLAGVDTRPTYKTLNAEVLAELAKLGPVLPAQFTLRRSHIDAMAEGKTGPEEDASARAEVERIWAAAKQIKRGKNV